EPPHTDLGADRHVAAIDDAAEQRADELLAVAVGVARGRVEERPARVDEVAQLGSGVVGVGVAGPRHGPEGERGDPQTGSAELTTFHVSNLPGRATTAAQVTADGRG